MSRPTDLRSVQAFLQTAITKANAQVLPDDVQALIADSDRLPALQHLAIYRRGYFARLLECLGQQFRVLRQTLGTELFDAFAVEYLELHPSSSYTLHDLGQHFPDFLENTRPDKEETERESWIDFMIDLARFEGMVFRLFDRPGEEDRGYAGFAVPDDQLRLQACFELAQFRFPVAAYYRLAIQGDLPEHPPLRESYVALCRKNYFTGIYELKGAAFFFLQEMRSGHTVAEALEVTRIKAKLTETEMAGYWEQWKMRWTEAGFFGAAVD